MLYFCVCEYFVVVYVVLDLFYCLCAGVDGVVVASCFCDDEGELVYL